MERKNGNDEEFYFQNPVAIDAVGECRTGWRRWYSDAVNVFEPEAEIDVVDLADFGEGKENGEVLTSGFAGDKQPVFRETAISFIIHSDGISQHQNVRFYPYYLGYSQDLAIPA